MKTYTVKAGQQAARPLVIAGDIFNRNPENGWEVRLIDGWDYELANNQWVKLCGDTFNPVKRDKNTILLAARNHPKKGLQITPYYNIDGKIYTADHPDTPDEMKKDWPVIQVQTGKRIQFGYKCEGARVTASILYDGQRVVHKIAHPGVGCIQSEVNFYFGGSLPAPNDIRIDKTRLLKLIWGPDNGILP